MKYITVSNWTMKNWDDSMLPVAQQKFVPMIQKLGATSVNMVRTSDNSMMVITKFPDAETAKTVSEKISDIRSEAAKEFKMTLDSVQAGEVVASD